MWRDAWLVAGKDLRIEARARVVLHQVVPFALVVVVLFAFALDPDSGVLERATAGLFWVAVLFASLLAVQRAFALEAADGNRDGLRLSGLDPAGVFFGKAGAIAAQLLVLEALLLAAVTVLYGTPVASAALLAVSAVAATAGLAATGSLFGVLALGLRVRETLLPLLLLPVVAPILIASTRAWEEALAGTSADGWPWVAVLGAFAAAYLTFGALTFGALLEDS